MMTKIKLIGDGITMQVLESKEGGVVDIEFVKAGKKINAKDIMSTQDHRKLLDHWARLSGQVPAFRLQERRAEKKNPDEVSQHKMGGPKIRH